SDPSHDPIRGNCIAVAGGGTIAPGTDVETRGNCPAGIPSRAFLTLPTACTGPLSTSYLAESWEGALDAGSVFTHDELTPPDPLGVSGCASLRFTPAITARPTTTTASSPTGIDVGLDVQDEGLLDPEGTAQSQIRRAEVTLPKGFTTNPSIAEGLTGCSEAQLEAETAGSPPGEGCPSASKIGTVQVQTPLLEQELSGSLYAATPYDNPFGTLLAVYMVIKNSALGIAIKQPLKVVPDPATGQLTALADELPQLPFSHFRVHFREGSRSPLASPPQCGSYDAVAKLTPWSGGPTLTTTSMFEITAGSGGGACPAGTPPLAPGFLAGTASNAAARYSEFDLRLTRGDPEQELRSFSVQMPPGLIGKVAGIPYCPDAAIEAARSKTGAQELSSPSCPAASRIGRLLVGAGVGPALSYVPGTLYLAGPFKGAQLSIVAITAAKVGPFDLGTVVIREGLKIDPDTAVVSLQPSASDPIPSIIKGIPVHARDIRVFVDRQEFVRNPTSCNPMAILSGVEGAGADPSIEADNQHATVSSRFQAADCASLAFGPQLSLGLKGGTKRTQLPRLRAVLTFPAGYNANIARAQVTLPHSVFLEQSHIRTICTRVQFAQGATPGEACPKGSIYGRARAITPLLSEPLEGPVFLRSSDHPLPDLVATLRNRQVAIDVVGRIDTDKKTARIRNTFEAVPDAPVSKFVLEMQGGKKGLLVNSTDLCRKKHRAKAVFTGHNGMGRTLRPVIKTSCKGKKK
ncbi:MAG: hypothetical protein ACTHLH_04050, partial [Solirubrobacterales bacterium]